MEIEGNSEIIPDPDEVKRTCLLANDNTFLLTAFKFALQPHFDIIDEALDGQEALDIVMQHKADHYTVIILDIDMPIMNGNEACKKIKSYLAEQQRSDFFLKVPEIYALTS